MPSASINGTTVDHEVVGEGPTCLVAHGGLGIDHTYLRPGLDVLAGLVRLVYYDHRGHGRSGRPPIDTLTVEQLADDADALADHVGADQVLVLGHAEGGFVAQELVLRHPDRVAGLVLVSTSPGQLGLTESLSDDQGPPPPVEVEVLQRVPPATDEEWAATMRALAAFYLHHPDPALEQSLFDRTIFDAEAAVRLMQVLGTWSAVDRLATVAVPTLVVSGGHDAFCPPAQSQRIVRAMGSAEFVVLEESGHLPWLEEPDAFCAAVERWLPTPK